MTKTVTLGEICKVSPEGFKPNGSNEYYVGLEHIEKDTGRLSPQAKEEPITTVKNRFRSGEILYGKLRPYLNKATLATRDGVCSTDILVLRPTADISPSYFLHYILSNKFVEDMSANVAGANLPRVSTKYILSYPIPLPPLPEQRRIAALLDRADALRQKDRQLLAHYDKLAQSIFLDLFGDPVKNEKGWERVKIRDLVREVKYGTSKPAEDKGTFPYLRMNNITYEGHWNFTDLKYINLTKAEEPKYLLQKGDLVFNRTNSKELVGKTAVYQRDDQMAIAGYLIRSRVNDKATPEYISAYLNSKHGKATLKGMCKNIIGMANINAQELQEIDILQPPLSLQTHFAQLMEQIERQKAVVRQQMAASEGLFGRLLQESFA